LAEHNHKFLCLPTYHPKLNPTELILGVAKNWVAEKNVTFKTDDIIKHADAYEEKTRNTVLIMSKLFSISI
jgi:transposase